MKDIQYLLSVLHGGAAAATAAALDKKKKNSILKLPTKE
jgi:hypothetical protein